MYKGLIAYIASFIVVIIIWSLALGYFPFLICLLFLSLLLVSFILSFDSMRKSEISFAVVSSIIQKGQNIQLHITRTQTSHIPCGHMIVSYQIYDSFDRCLYNRKLYLKSTITNLTMRMNSIGAYRIVVNKVYNFDILQCVAFKHRCNQECQFYVFPILNESYAHLEEGIGFYEDSLDYSQYHKGQDYSEVFNLRKFREDDSLKHIHWKATMKKNEVYVKEGGQPIIKKILLAVQWQESLDSYNLSLERFYSMCLMLLKRGIDFEILCPDSQKRLKVESIQNDVYFKECFIRILKTSSYPLEETITSLKGYSHVYVITSEGIEVRHL